MDGASMPFESRFFRASDGLRLHMRDYGAHRDPGLPVVCLPGLTRSAADFDRVAQALSTGASGRKRRVVALDYRGRGGSDHDANWQNYNLAVEGADIRAVLAAADIGKAIFLGTSRGGLHVMTLATSEPALVHAAILNDIGPVLEPEGLARIRGYVGKLAPPRSLSEAVALLQSIMGRQFDGLTAADWDAHARATFEDDDGPLGARYDPALMHTLEGLDLTAPLPDLWPQFEALRGIPLLVIRGANSDLLAPATLAEMGRRHNGCSVFTVPGQGHAPLLLDPASIERICAFVGDVDSPEAGSSAQLPR